MDMNYQREQQYGGYVNELDKDRMLSSALTGSFVWMAVGLLISAVTAWVVANSPLLLSLIFSSNATFYGIVIAELALVFIFSLAIGKINAGTATVLFLLYALLNGATLASIFFVFDMSTISVAFISTAGMFGAMAVYGAMTKKNLSSWGSLLLMGLFGIIIATIINIFVGSTMVDMVISYIGIAVFLGLTAYDTQKIKAMVEISTSEQQTKKIMIVGALNLYLDFINIFLKVLRLLNRRN